MPSCIRRLVCMHQWRNWNLTGNYMSKCWSKEMPEYPDTLLILIIIIKISSSSHHRLTIISSSSSSSSSSSPPSTSKSTATTITGIVRTLIGRNPCCTHPSRNESQFPITCTDCDSWPPHLHINLPFLTFQEANCVMQRHLGEEAQCQHPGTPFSTGADRGVVAEIIRPDQATWSKWNAEFSENMLICIYLSSMLAFIAK